MQTVILFWNTIITMILMKINYEELTFLLDFGTSSSFLPQPTTALKASLSLSSLFSLLSPFRRHHHCHYCHRKHQYYCHHCYRRWFQLATCIFTALPCTLQWKTPPRISENHNNRSLLTYPSQNLTTTIVTNIIGCRTKHQKSQNCWHSLSWPLFQLSADLSIIWQLWIILIFGVY